MIAIIVRGSANPDPFSVWTYSVFAPASRRKRMFERRAWKSPTFEHDDTSSHSLQPGAHSSRSYVLRAPKPMSPVQRIFTRYGISNRRQISSALSRSVSNSSSDFSGRQYLYISTLSNWKPRLMPRTSRPADIGSLRKQGVYAT